LYKFLRKIALDLGRFEISEILNKPFIFSDEIIPRRLSFKRDHANDSVENEKAILSSIIKRLPNNPSDEVPVQEYLNLLDEVLADRIVTQEEADGILDLISEFGLSQSQVMDIHIQYLRNLIHVYYLDHILSDSEKRDLIKVSEILGISTDQLEEFIDQEFQRIEASGENNTGQSQHIDLSNRSICFTGQLVSTKNGEPILRSVAQSLALERGMIIKSGVSSKLDYLVTADPSSLSGKSQKARELGIKILAEPVFWQMMRYNVD
jgi:DNA polymerase-3 subunit epsilon